MSYWEKAVHETTRTSSGGNQKTYKNFVQLFDHSCCQTNIEFIIGIKYYYSTTCFSISHAAAAALVGGHCVHIKWQGPLPPEPTCSSKPICFHRVSNLKSIDCQWVNHKLSCLEAMRNPCLIHYHSSPFECWGHWGECVLRLFILTVDIMNTAVSLWLYVAFLQRCCCVAGRVWSLASCSSWEGKY